ncbi:hypothetical protein [Absidia glauca]|nr:hypothetical protein [Absidia glauca]
MAPLNWVDDKAPDSVDMVIQKAMHMETQAQIMRDLQQASSAPASTMQPFDPNAMDVDHVQVKHSQRDSKGNKTPSSSNNKQLRYVYDKDGNPICGHCNKKHRTKDCSQHQSTTTSPDNTNNSAKSKRSKRGKGNKHDKKRSSVATADTQDDNLGDTQHKVNEKTIVHISTLDTSPLPFSHLTDPYSADTVNEINNSSRSSTPKCTLYVNNTACDALVDTGADISLIHLDLANKLKLHIDSATTISYMDVNQHVLSTIGCTTIQLLSTTINLHVINRMKHEVILGWDSIRKLNGIIDSATNSVTLRQGRHQ